MAKKKKKIKFKQYTHVLIPKHIPIKEKEKKALLERYKISERELPKILKDDAAIRHLNLKQGDVVKIIRPSLTAETTVYYRVVINE